MVLEKNTLEVECSPLNINNKVDDRTEHKDEKNLSEQNSISQKNLIENLYKTFGNKIKKIILPHYFFNIRTIININFTRVS